MATPIEKWRTGMTYLQRGATQTDWLGPALVHIHAALEDHFDAWLHEWADLSEEEHDQLGTQGWQTRLQQMTDYGELEQASCRTILRFNTIRNKVAHGDAYTLTRAELAPYAEAVIGWMRAYPLESVPPVPAQPLKMPIQPMPHPRPGHIDGDKLIRTMLIHAVIAPVGLYGGTFLFLLPQTILHTPLTSFGGIAGFTMAIGGAQSMLLNEYEAREGAGIGWFCAAIVMGIGMLRDTHPTAVPLAIILAGIISGIATWYSFAQTLRYALWSVLGTALFWTSSVFLLDYLTETYAVVGGMVASGFFGLVMGLQIVLLRFIQERRSHNAQPDMMLRVGEG